MYALIQHEKVSVTNSVIVSGLTQTEVDQDLEEFLVGYGPLSRTLVVDDPISKFHRHTIVEFANSSTMCTLRPLLPMEYTSPTDKGVTFQVQALDSVYTPVTEPLITQSYLSNLKELAMKSGKDFTTLLQELMSEISEAMKETETEGTLVVHPPVKPSVNPHAPATLLCPVSEELVKNLPTVLQPSPLLLRRTLFEPSKSVLIGSPSDNAQRIPISTRSPLTMPLSPSACPVTTGASVMSVLTPDTINPPEVQKLVVEHIVRGGEMATRAISSLKLRTFSGKIPRPNNEADYDTWRSHAELILKDTTMSDLQKSLRIRESLIPPASDVVKRLGPGAEASSYIQLLDAAYDTVEDGDELIAKFINTLQDSGEKTSTYLHRLQAVLNQAVRRGGVAAEEADRHLLKQLCRGCWNTTLLHKLEPLKDNPPSFADLLLLLRGEEDKEASRAIRMKQHLGFAKPRAASCAQNTLAWEEGSGVASLQQQMEELQGQFTTLISSRQEKGSPKPTKAPGKKSSHRKSEPVEVKVNTNRVEVSEISELKKQIANLQTQLARTTKRQSESAAHSRGTATQVEAAPADSDACQPRYSGTTAYRPRPWYCFNCGEDGHIATHCENVSNPAKVEEKKRQLRDAQAKWDHQNNVTDTSPLNRRQSPL